MRTTVRIPIIVVTIPAADGKMMDQVQYYEALYRELAAHRLVPGSNLWRIGLDEAVDEIGIDKGLFTALKKKYRACFHETALINAKKNLLLCRNFHVEVSKRLIASSVYFSVLGCVLDFLLDSGVPEFVKTAKERLSWDFCKKAFAEFGISETENEIDRLFYEVSQGMKILRHQNRIHCEKILETIRRACLSELRAAGMLDSGSGKETEVYNKSVLFIRAALMLALGGEKQWNGEENRAIETIGSLYAYMDDLIDVFEDEESGQWNIVSLQLKAGRPAVQVIEDTVGRIEKGMLTLKAWFDVEFTDLLENELREWLFSNPYLAEKFYAAGGYHA